MLAKSRETESRQIRDGQWQKEAIRYRAGRLIVKFKAVPEGAESTAASLCADVASALPDGELIGPLRPSGRAVFSVPSSASIPQLAAQISKRDDVEYAEPDVIDKAAMIPSDTRFGQQWAPTKVGAPAAWDLQTGASGILVGIIDSGISMDGNGGLNHPDLNDAGRFILGTDFVDGGTPMDLNGHGTHVVGIAAALSNNGQGVAGMNWNSPVYICRTLDANGNGSSADFADAIEEIVDFAVAQNLKVVINYSGGGGANQTKQEACKYVNDHGMILCAATGNDSGPVIWPAAYSTMFDGVIAVGSTDDTDTVSDFSNFGPEVTVVAPGRNILSTMPTYAVQIPVALNYDELDGTSMATPLVTGLVSLMWSRHPGFTNKAIRDCLTGTAVKLGAGSFDNTWGHGRVDAPNALKCGDLIFTPFTRFTNFTLFTPLTPFTSFTPFTRFTNFTLFTPLTPFTSFTRFTNFTLFTPFTPFTPFTRFTPFTAFTRFVPTGPERPIEPRPFVRFGNTLIDPQTLEIGRFSELQAVAADLAALGIVYVDQVATSDVAALAEALDYAPEDAARLVDLTQNLIRQM